MKIDFVLLWVNPSDTNWVNDFNKYQNNEFTLTRYRDWDNLQYIFRSFEKFTPWVNNIFFITYSHVPEWLNTNISNIKVIKHSEFIPIEILPTFNSLTIEMYLHRINELSEHFVLFNDDFFIIDHVKKDRFFKNNLPCDIPFFNVYHGAGLSINNLVAIDILNNNFNQRKYLKKNLFKIFKFMYSKYYFTNIFLSIWPFFIGFIDHHFPQPYLKSVFLEVWNKEGDNIYNSTKSKFRTSLNISHYLFRYWQIITSNFYPLNVFRDSIFFSINDNNIDKITTTIRNKSKKILVLNDSCDSNYESNKLSINNEFSKLFPFKSKYEK